MCSVSDWQTLYLHPVCCTGANISLPSSAHEAVLHPVLCACLPACLLACLPAVSFWLSDPTSQQVVRCVTYYREYVKAFFTVCYRYTINVMLFTSTRKYGVHTPLFAKLTDSSVRFLVPKSTKYAKHIYRYIHLRLSVKYGWRLADIDQTHANATNSCKICCTEFHEKPTTCLFADRASG